jgi:hypothetical protein
VAVRSVLLDRGAWVGRPARRVAAVLAAVLTMASVTSCTVQAGSAVVLDGTTVSEQSVQHDTALFIQENSPTTPLTDSDKAAINRSQINYLVRHALIEKAAAAQNIAVTDQQVEAMKAAVATQSPHGSVAAGLNLPSSDDAGVLHDLVALAAMAQALSGKGVPVQNISVTAEGVRAATRDEAVSLRSKYLAHPADLDAAIATAGTNTIARHAYNLVQNPGAGAAGLYQAVPDRVFILAQSSGYLVLRATSRTVTSTPLTAAAFAAVLQPDSSGAAPSLSSFFDLGALLVSKYQDATSIAVNPRYGVWDPASVQVVPGNDGL